MTDADLDSTPGANIAPDRLEEAVLALVRELVRELHGGWAATIRVTSASRLDRDLGFDSLGRTELVMRAERAFRVRLPVRLIAEAETVGDLVEALRQAAPRDRHGPAARPIEIAQPAITAPIATRTLIDVLETHAADWPDRMHATVLEDESTILGTLTYAQLADAARAVARGLVARGVAPGDRVALMLPTGVDFFSSFFGVLYAGAVPVPIYPPARLSQIEEHVQRQAGILNNAGARLLITVPQAAQLATVLRGMVGSLAMVDSAESLTDAGGDHPLPAPAGEGATAFIQYTSGSTGDPKGVVLSHANLLANIRAIGDAVDATSSDVFVSWLPLYHDLGLIGGWLGSLYFGASFYVMSPLSFLARPESWLWAIHRFRGTLSASPNFGFETCVSKLPDQALEGLDLSSLRMVANGAEPVSINTLRRFTARFGRFGFSPGAMAPAYGLAENTVALTFPPLGRPPRIDRVDREALARDAVARPAAADAARTIEIVSCGKPLKLHEVRIVDRNGAPLADRHEGRIEFRGPSATTGYFQNDAKTRELFHDGWLDTGDQGYLADGELFVTARVKDIIIRAGRHIYPQEIEDAIGEIPGVIRNGVAAFGMSDPRSGTERTIILVETDQTDQARRSAIEAQAFKAASGILGLSPEEVVLVEPQTVPKTSSGKIRRSAARDLYAGGQLEAVRRGFRMQMWRLAATAAFAKARDAVRQIPALLFAAWWWTVIGLLAPVAILAMLVVPQLEWRWAVLRTLARGALIALGVPLSREGLHRAREGSAVLVFNHASYTDALALAASLPGAPVFVAKKEFADQFIVGFFLRRLGVLFVERFNVMESLADTEAAIAVARQGRPLVFFPEGTFTAQTGLHGFHLGAFKIAADAGLPIVPGIIRGTRTMLPAYRWFPRWTPISVRLESPLRASGNDFAAALQLRNAVRAVILAHCGEPDLGAVAKIARS